MPIDNYRRHEEDDNTVTTEKSIHQLLKHMRRVRESVPVNYQLQEELRQKLISQMQGTARKGPSDRPVERQHVGRKVPPYAWVILPVVLLVVLVLALWHHSAGTILQPVGGPKEVARFWNGDVNISFTVSPNTNNILVARHGQLLLVDKIEKRYRVLNLPPDYLYHSPAFSPDGARVAMVRQNKEGFKQIVVVPAAVLIGAVGDDGGKFKVLVTGRDSSQLTDLTWSPDGSKLAYTEIDRFDTARVWVVDNDNNPQLLTAGMHPTWSPDGTKLVVQRPMAGYNDALYLIDLENHLEVMLGQGEQPIWGSSGHLAFVSTRQQEKVLTFMPDGSPQFTVRQRVGEIRSVYAGDSGEELQEKLNDNHSYLASSTLLVSPDGGNTREEMEWLHQLEIQGIREPRVLLLDTVNRCHNPVLQSSEKALYYLCQKDISAALMRVDLEERLFSRGEE
ncbi:TolB protein [Desulfohalotomaculum tongense]|uniref:PD40 domain-containing protein n=1 Tax=Desulforadius tongensis TaxID=1216062 RepID=UPI00195770F7|nr:PD40 domain-containing protein [Desulforadius tongensis]MBM7856014.1 TolB protein [Desulforadius tongensis]